MSVKSCLRDCLTPRSNSSPFLIRGIRRFSVPTTVKGSPFIACQPGNWSSLKRSALPRSRARWAVSRHTSDPTLMACFWLCLCVCVPAVLQCMQWHCFWGSFIDCSTVLTSLVDTLADKSFRTPLPNSWPSWTSTWQFTSKMTFPITFPSWLLPGSWAVLAAVRHWAACSEASDVLAFCPVSVTVADWQWLRGYPSFTYPPRVLGSKCYRYCERRCHFLSLDRGSTHNTSGSNATAFIVVWMTT